VRGGDGEIISIEVGVVDGGEVGIVGVGGDGGEAFLSLQFEGGFDDSGDEAGVDVPSVGNMSANFMYQLQDGNTYSMWQWKSQTCRGSGRLA